MNLTKRHFLLPLGVTLLTTGASAQLVHSVSTGNSATWALEVDQTRGLLYLAGTGTFADGEWMIAYDVSDPTNPIQVGGISDGGGASTVALHGNYAYVGAGHVLRVVDVSDPANMFVCGSVVTHVGNLASGLSEVVVSADGNTAYVQMRAHPTNGSLVTVDVSDPYAPVVLDSMIDGNYTNHVDVIGTTVYTSGWYKAYTFDVSDPSDIQQTAYTSFNSYNGDNFEVHESGQAYWVNGLGLYPYESPGTKVMSMGFGQFDTEFIGDVGVSVGPGGLYVIDLANPQAPVVTCQYGVKSDPWQVNYLDGYAYVAYRNGILDVFDVGDCVVLDVPPVAAAGADFSVDEGQALVLLDGSASSDADGDALTYAWSQVAGTPVTIIDGATAQAAFDAPLVAFGGETLTFELAVTANGVTVSDQVNVTVVNVNHPPVADAGDDPSVAEGSPVTLGPDPASGSFDVDNDTFTYAWSQVSGPAVALSSASAAQPTFTAPMVASGATETLVFSLTVDDGFPADAPAPGYTLADSTDTVSVTVTNVNNPPVALAGADQTANENTLVALSGGGSDPDGDALSYSWSQVGGLAVVMTGELTATPSFTVPFVNPGGGTLAFELTVDDGYGGSATDTVLVHVQNANDPPLVSAAAPTVDTLWPPRHDLVLVGITGVSDPDDNATIVITGVTQDEPTNGTGDGDTAIDAIVNADGTVYLRAERAGNGDGRVYHIHFTASDLEGSASGVITVSVPHKKKSSAVDGGELYDSTL